MNGLIDKAQSWLRTAKGPFSDDDVMVIHGAGNPGSGDAGRALLFVMDPDIAAIGNSVAPHKLLRNDGTVVTEIIHSVKPANPDLIKDNLTVDRGSKIYTYRSFLSSNAMRATNSLDGIDYCTSNNSAACALPVISAPLLIMVMGANDFVRDESGKPVTSRMDAARLGEIAKETGGFYQPFGQDAAMAIYEKGIVPMEEQESGTISSRKPIERYQWPVTAALVLLALWSLLGEGRRRPRATSLLVFALISAFSLQTASASGLSDYKQGNYQGALKDFESRLEKGANAAEIKFDAGAAAYKAGDFKKAAGYFSEAMTSAKQKLRDDATYNLANALVRTGEAAQESEAKLADWKNALQHYEGVLKSDPKNVQAKENRDIVKKLIEDQKKKQDQQ